MSRRRSARNVLGPQDSATLFAALGDTARSRLVFQLCERGPMSITRLSAGANITRQAITKHLLVMEEAGLVRSIRRGRENVWQLNQQRLNDASHYLDVISKQWDAALGRLLKFVED